MLCSLFPGWVNMLAIPRILLGLWLIRTVTSLPAATKGESAETDSCLWTNRQMKQHTGQMNRCPWNCLSACLSVGTSCVKCGFGKRSSLDLLFSLSHFCFCFAFVFVFVLFLSQQIPWLNFLDGGFKFINTCKGPMVILTRSSDYSVCARVILSMSA